METEKEQIEFIFESKLSVNYDINKEGIKRKIFEFFNFWKESFNLLMTYLKILYMKIEISYMEENIFLYQVEIKILKEVLKYAKK